MLAVVIITTRVWLLRAWRDGLPAQISTLPPGPAELFSGERSRLRDPDLSPLDDGTAVVGAPAPG